ncbi:MAG: GntR family transcriptional regulator [Gemmatimonadaceae bacterium]|nr:GntR family transcriptional regulator [Gemmatimonadaceae bacterium]
MKASPAPAARGARPMVVYQTLRARIVRGQLAPGSRIVETDVAARLQVSRPPVRGALQRLQQEGYIVDSPSLLQSRPMVAPLTREDAMELFSIVAEIEGLAARCAAQLDAGPRERLATALAALNDRLGKASRAKVPRHDLLYDLDERFHRAYVTAAAGPRLRALHDVVKPQAERYERLYVSLLSRGLAPSVAEHAAIIRAIRAGDADAAQRAVQANWRNAADRLGRVISSVGERGQW